MILKTHETWQDQMLGGKKKLSYRNSLSSGSNYNSKILNGAIHLLTHAQEMSCKRRKKRN